MNKFPFQAGIGAYDFQSGCGTGQLVLLEKFFLRDVIFPKYTPSHISREEWIICLGL